MKKEQELWEENGRIKARIIIENLLVRIFSKQDYELEKSKKILEEVPSHGIHVDTIHTGFYQILELLLMCLGGLLIFGFWGPLNTISNISQINRVWEKYEKLKKFIYKEIEIKDGNKKYKFRSGNIEIKDLKFSYSGKKYIFDRLNLDFLSGKKNALVGHSGSGKSTIVKILLRFYDYESGKILVDG